jgi:hypothetical protein
MSFRVQLSTRAGKGWPAHRAKIIFLTVHKDADYATDASGAGGSAYIVKSSPVGQHLDGDIAPEFGVVRAIYLTQPASTQRTKNFIGAMTRAGKEGVVEIESHWTANRGENQGIYPTVRRHDPA